MRKHVLVLMTTAAILACGTIAGSAQTPGTQTGAQQSPVTHPTLGGPTMQHQETQRTTTVLPFEDEDDQNEIYLIGPGMMGSHGVLPLESENEQNGIYLIRPETMSSGMMGRGWHHGWRRGHAMMAPVIERIIFSLMDADGDGTVSLQEWQAAHERIFKAMDTDHDGTVTFEEMQAFVRGR
jgi:EF hand